MATESGHGWWRALLSIWPLRLLWWSAKSKGCDESCFGRLVAESYKDEEDGSTLRTRTYEHPDGRTIQEITRIQHPDCKPMEHQVFRYE